MMTVTQAERLARKITEVMAQSVPASEAQTAKLAQEYAELCRSASRRLEQCALMIEAGQSLQALQLAETPPPLLDTITVLAFRHAADWRAYCQAHQLPWAEPFYDKFIRQVNAAYGQGVASDHPYYRDYRRAVLKNDDERALSILRVIARMNPADENTRQELKRVEEKLLRVKLERLQQVVATGNAAATQEELQRIEAGGGPVPSSHPIWQRAQTARCQELLRRAEDFRQADAWQDAEVLVEEIHDIATRNNVQLPAADADAWTSLEAWTSARRGAYAQEQDFRRALAGLDYEIKTIEARRARQPRMGGAEAQKFFESLGARFLDAKRFGQSIDEDLNARRQRCQFWIEEQIQRAKFTRRIAIASVTVVILALIGAAIPTIMSRASDKLLLTHLAALESSRRVAETESEIGKIPETRKAEPPVSAAVGRAQRFVAKEKDLKRAFDEEMQRLNQWAAGGFQGDLSQVIPRRAQAIQDSAQLAPEFQGTAQNDLSAWDAKWQSFRNAKLDSQIKDAEQLAGNLNGGSGYDAVRAAIPKIQSILAGTTVLQAEPPSLDPSLQTRLRALSTQASDWAARAEQWEKAQTALLESQTSDDYLQHLDQMVQSPFASDAQRQAAAEIDRMKINESTLLGELLMPDNRDKWDTLTKASSWRSTFMPEQPTAAEKNTYFNLRDDKSMQNVYVYNLTANTRTNNPNRSHSIFVQGTLSRDRAGDMTGAVFDPQQYQDSARFVPVTYDEWDYHYIVRGNRTAECDAFERLGLGDLIDAGTGNYQKSILQLVDQLNRYTNASPLFRAMVILELFNIANSRPDEWGLQWCPAATREFQQLKRLGAADVKSGDWMAAGPVAKYGPALDSYFEQARLTSLETQAEFLQQLTQKACQTDFTFAGFVDVNGHPVLRDAHSPAREYWGWGGSGRSAGLLLRKTGDDDSLDRMMEPVPFTPLFVFNGDRRVLLRDTAQTFSYPASAQEAAALLPPFFAGVYE